MPEWDVLLKFAGLAVVLALSPGPDNLFVLLQSAQHGWRTGVRIVLGLCIGVLVHTCAVALGLAAVVAASATAFTVLKVLGAAYLLWLAWGAWNAPVSAVPVPVGRGRGEPPSARPSLRMVGRGVVMNLSNPKVLMFFLAFLPQFADPARGHLATQIVVLGGVFALVTLLVFGSIACFSGVFGQLLQQSARSQRLLNRLASVVFAGMAVRLLGMHRG